LQGNTSGELRQAGLVRFREVEPPVGNCETALVDFLPNGLTVARRLYWDSLRLIRRLGVLQPLVVEIMQIRLDVVRIGIHVGEEEIRDRGLPVF